MTLGITIKHCRCLLGRQRARMSWPRWVATDPNPHRGVGQNVSVPLSASTKTGSDDHARWRWPVHDLNDHVAAQPALTPDVLDHAQP